MAVRGLIIFVALFSSLAVSCYGEVMFHDLAHSLTVSATTSGKANVKAGKDQITVTWALNRSIAGVDTSAYREAEAKLCYLPESQKDRPWRKTEEEMARDKTCQFAIVKKEYTSSSDSITYTVKKDVPTAHYFIRVYVRDGPGGKLLAYGQTTGLDLYVIGISGRSASIDIAASIFSAFSVISLGFFFYLEKKKSKRAT